MVDIGTCLRWEDIVEDIQWPIPSNNISILQFNFIVIHKYNKKMYTLVQVVVDKMVYSMRK